MKDAGKLQSPASSSTTSPTSTSTATKAPPRTTPCSCSAFFKIAVEGGLTQEIMPVTGELAFRFASYWSVVAQRQPQRPELNFPSFI